MTPSLDGLGLAVSDVLHARGSERGEVRLHGELLTLQTRSLLYSRRLL